MPCPGWMKCSQKGNQSFYKVENGKRLYYDVSTGYLRAHAGRRCIYCDEEFRKQTVWKNSACRLYHLGDDVLGLEWYTKMGSIGGEVLEGIQKSISIAEEKYKGLVIANEGQNFSAGANVGMIFMLAIEQEYDELDMAIRMFQQTMMRARYSAVPVWLRRMAYIGGSLRIEFACRQSLRICRNIYWTG